MLKNFTIKNYKSIKETEYMVAMIVLLLTMINTQVWATDSLQVNLLPDTNHLLPDTNLLNLGDQPTVYKETELPAVK